MGWVSFWGVPHSFFASYGFWVEALLEGDEEIVSSSVTRVTGYRSVGCEFRWRGTAYDVEIEDVDVPVSVGDQVRLIVSASDPEAASFLDVEGYVPWRVFGVCVGVGLILKLSGGERR